MKICQNGSTFFGWNLITLLHSIWLFFQKKSGILPVILKSYPQDAQQNANMFFSFTQHTPSISHFSVVASLVFTPLNGLRNEGDHKRCRYQGGQNMQKCKQKTHKTKGKTWWSTKLHTTNHRLWKRKKLAFLAGFARPFSGIKWQPQGRANPKQV